MPVVLVSSHIASFWNRGLPEATVAPPLPEKGEFWQVEKYVMDCFFYTMIEFCHRALCQFSFGTNFNENCSRFQYLIWLSWRSENQEDIFWDSPKQGQIRWPRKIYRELFLSIFFIFMIEEHVSFHFQQISSWINRAFRVLFHFPESWKIRNFLLTAPNKANFDGSKYIFKSLFSVYFFIIMQWSPKSTSDRPRRVT